MKNNSGVWKIASFLLLLSSLVHAQTTVTFSYTGGPQSWTVPAGVTSITVDAKGAGGGNGNAMPGANGGRVQATLQVTPGSTLYFYVGGKGTDGQGASVDQASPGGFNGGGNGGFDNSGQVENGGGGGGASDIRSAGNTLSDRLIVAGGGGGGAAGFFSLNNPSGAGGGLVGQSAANYSNLAIGGGGGSQVAGGSAFAGRGATPGALGIGGNGSTNQNAWGSAGGGGGYYGGGGGSGVLDHSAGYSAGGGGGSSYTDPALASAVVHTQGYQSGNGEIIITYTETASVNCPPNITVDAVAGQCGTNVSYSATGTGTITYSPASGSFFPVGTTTVTATSTTSGGTASCTFTVTVQDKEPPVLAVLPPNPVTISQLGRKTTYTNVSLNGGPNYIVAAPNTPLTLTANYSASYDGGAGCPGCITQHYVQFPGQFSLCHDATYGSGGINQSFTAPSTPGTYYITQVPTWWYYCNQFGTPPYNNTPEDAIAVVIVPGGTNCRPDITVNATASQCGAVVKYTAPTAIDNCSGATVNQTTGLPSGSTFPVGTTTNTFVATDASGNTATCSFTVTVTENEKPVITTNGNMTVNNDPGVCGANVSATASATDNCSVGTPTGIRSDAQALNAVYPVGTTTITWNVTDANGNAATPVTQTVTVNDNEKPNAACKNVTVTLIGGNASITTADVNNNSTDNCGIQSLALDKTSFNCSNIGANTVTLTVTDIHGNVSTCAATVTVAGTIPTCTIASVPSNSTYTGGVSTNLYLGYGPQSTTLQVSAPTSGAPYTYIWSASPATGLSNLDLSNPGAPVFTPTAQGVYTFTVKTTNKYGCSNTCSITICVLDIRVPGSNGKVYVCHYPQGNTGNVQTLSLSVDAVPAHIFVPGHGDHLGRCDQTPCSGSPSMTTMARPSSLPRLEENVFNLSAAPNPSTGYFNVLVKSDNQSPVEVRVVDMLGRIVFRQTGVAPNTTLRIGEKFGTGGYFVEAIQGANRQSLKLLKAKQ